MPFLSNAEIEVLMSRRICMRLVFTFFLEIGLELMTPS